MKPLLVAFILCIPLPLNAQVNTHVPTIDEVGATRMPATIAPVKALFPMPVFKIPSFPTYTITIKDSKDIQSAINTVHQHGGGTVIIPLVWK
ncbi:hypothetical protein [Chitinophaga sp. LS1]|uniref:hypothetical protein n=1 Tax=Chitinophaga sp. LS1 TaxID=3051176 RepID=UPI002AAAEF84|nr:hypothetical protein [Chitinophaga sp. LS1]WPV63745.1 hypothetical protein QQL36_18255 [Chitinophaga sp. LS1]